jgi:hypothetical protein
MRQALSHAPWVTLQIVLSPGETELTSRSHEMGQ